MVCCTLFAQAAHTERLTSGRAAERQRGRRTTRSARRLALDSLLGDGVGTALSLQAAHRGGRVARQAGPAGGAPNLAPRALPPSTDSPRLLLGRRRLPCVLRAVHVADADGTSPTVLFSPCQQTQ